MSMKTTVRQIFDDGFRPEMACLPRAVLDMCSKDVVALMCPNAVRRYAVAKRRLEVLERALRRKGGDSQARKEARDRADADMREAYDRILAAAGPHVRL
jgi:hypothetical protein